MPLPFPQFLPVLLLIAASPVAAQDLAPVATLPPEAITLLSTEAAPDFTLGWEGDLDGDGDADLLAQAAYPAGDGGNAAVLRQMLLRREGDGYSLWREVVLPEGIKSARLEGRELALMLYQYLPDDPHCCPSGETPFRLPLD